MIGNLGFPNLISVLISGVLAVMSLPTSAYEEFPETTPDPHQGKTEFNGMTLKQFGDFTKWELVTVRYRRDSNEMRFVYANPIAWKGLKAGGKAYEEGAIFAKIGVVTQDDKNFPSSAVPSGAARFQFMIKNKKKYATTDGWGYALFDQNGKTFGGEPKAAVIACHACHRLVPHKDFVFSIPADFSSLVTGSKTGQTENSATNFAASMSWSVVPAAQLPEELQKYLPEEHTQIDSVRGEIQKNLFLGTLDEIRPLLIQKSLATGRPAGLLSADGKMFSLIFRAAKENAKCRVGEKSFIHLIKSSPNQLKIAQKRICQ